MDGVRALVKRGDLDVDMPAIRAVGYRRAWSYLAGDDTKEAFREKAIIATRQLAKRQFTWLRQQTDVTWFETGDAAVLGSALEKFKTTKLE